MAGHSYAPLFAGGESAAGGGRGPVSRLEDVQVQSDDHFALVHFVEAQLLGDRTPRLPGLPGDVPHAHLSTSQEVCAGRGRLINSDQDRKSVV